MDRWMGIVCMVSAKKNLFWSNGHRFGQGWRYDRERGRDGSDRQSSVVPDTAAVY